MRKIPTLFKRDPDDLRYVTREVHPECKWVLDGEGVATRKYDGTCVMFDGEKWWARREVKPGKSIPAGWVQVDHDDVTRKSVGWEPIEQSAFVKFHADAVDHAQTAAFPPGTYELIGPKVNGNPEKLNRHVLIAHAVDGEKWWARREVKPGKSIPAGWVQVDHDDVTRKSVGWEPIEQSAFVKFHADAVDHAQTAAFPPGTYELIGPKVNGNPEKLNRHVLIAHAAAGVLEVPRDFDGLAAELSGFPYEGVVWHHPDGRMAKLKRRDFPAADRG